MNVNVGSCKLDSVRVQADLIFGPTKLPESLCKHRHTSRGSFCDSRMTTSVYSEKSEFVKFELLVFVLKTSVSQQQDKHSTSPSADILK